LLLESGACTGNRHLPPEDNIYHNVVIAFGSGLEADAGDTITAS